MTAVLSFERNAAVRRLCEKWGQADDQMLRDILGIVDHHGNLLPDDDRHYDLPHVEKVSRDGTLASPNPSMNVRPAASTAPDALRNLPPVVVPPKPVAAPKPRKPRERKPGAQQVHGTVWGYRRHRQNGEQACEPCTEAKRAEWRAEKAKRDGRNATTAPRREVQCGDAGGYKRHYREGTPVCDACVQARRAYEQSLRARHAATRKPAPPRPHGDCGTLAGARYHRRHGLDVCEPCRTAERAYQRDRYHARKAAA